MNWYKTAQLSTLTDEQRTKKGLVKDKLGMETLSIIKAVRTQNPSLNLGQAIEYIYDRMEKGLEPMTCKGCRWLKSYQNKQECTNSNWKPSDEIENAACGGISWENLNELV